jgi:hypothetical protein
MGILFARRTHLPGNVKLGVVIRDPDVEGSLPPILLLLRGGRCIGLGSESLELPLGVDRVGLRIHHAHGVDEVPGIELGPRGELLPRGVLPGGGQEAVPGRVERPV